MDADVARIWLVDRTVTEKPSLINHIYATPDGDRYLLIERSSVGSQPAEHTTASIEVDTAKLSEVKDRELQDAYAAEATRMAERHDPEDVIA